MREEIIDASPLAKIAPPTDRADEIQPFDIRQVVAMMDTSQTTLQSLRDFAIVCLLFDTGIRAMEPCGLKHKDLDLTARKVVVLGKGRKKRVLYFGVDTAAALTAYLHKPDRADIDAIFHSERIGHPSAPLTPSGLLQLIHRLGDMAGIEAVRCSPHTFRHIFAVTFLRNGGNVFSLQKILGHTDLKMTNRYVAISQADVENQLKLYGPVDRLAAGEFSTRASRVHDDVALAA